MRKIQPDIKIEIYQFFAKHFHLNSIEYKIKFLQFNFIVKNAKSKSFFYLLTYLSLHSVLNSCFLFGTLLPTTCFTTSDILLSGNKFWK